VRFDLQPTGGEEMVARMWRGWAGADVADEIASHLREIALARYDAAPGNVSTSVLVRPLAGGVELVTLTVWDSGDAVPAGVVEDHPLLVARQTIADLWEVAGAPQAVARAA
jgi:heme-degrading monooxygenase HmoA